MTNMYPKGLPLHSDDDALSSTNSGTLFEDTVAAVRLRIIPLSFWLVFCLGAACAYVFTATPEYVSTAQIVLEARSRATSTADPLGGSAMTLDSAQADSQLQVIRSERNLRLVFDKLNLENDPMLNSPNLGVFGRIAKLFGGNPAANDSLPDETIKRQREVAFQNFFDRVTVRRLGQSYVIEVSVRALTPQAAAKLCNSVAAAYIRDQVYVRAATEQRGTEFLQGRIAGIQAEKQALNDAVASGIIPDIQFPDADARVVSVALEPLAKAYPQTRLILALAIAFALFSGLGAISIIQSIDSSIRSIGHARSKIQDKQLWELPRLPKWQARGGKAYDLASRCPHSDYVKALRPLQARVRRASKNSGLGSIGLVSVDSDDQRSVLSANLAQLLANAGTEVVLIDCDFDNTRITNFYAPSSAGNLRGIPKVVDGHGEISRIEISPALWFLPAIGSPGPEGHPGFDDMQRISRLIKLSAASRLAIIDFPTLSDFTDFGEMGDICNGIILFGSLGKTQLSAMTQAVQAFDRADIPILGIAFGNS